MKKRRLATRTSAPSWIPGLRGLLALGSQMDGEVALITYHFCSIEFLVRPNIRKILVNSQL